jgi:hypothetical protein
MILRSKRDYLESIRQRYRHAPRKAKGLIIEEFLAICGYHRKYAIRLLRKPKRKSPVVPFANVPVSSRSISNQSLGQDGRSFLFSYQNDLNARNSEDSRPS